MVSGLPGQSGIPWTPEQTKIMQTKLKLIWNDGYKSTRSIDAGDSGATSTQYFYDPTRKTIVPDCPCCCDIGEKGKCLASYPNCEKSNKPTDTCEFKEDGLCSGKVAAK